MIETTIVSQTIRIIPLILVDSREMLRDDKWRTYAKTTVWLSFDALTVVHRVTAMTSGTRCSVTLYIPGKFERLTWQTQVSDPSYHAQTLEPQLRKLT